MAFLLHRRGKQFALAAAVAAAAYSFSPAAVEPTAAGHLGLVRSLPGMGELNALLTKEAFLLDATHALQAAILRVPPLAGKRLRLARGIVVEKIALCETEGKTEGVAVLRLFLALLDTRDGHFDAALETYARMAEEYPGDHMLRLCACGLCYLIGRPSEGKEWLAIPKDTGTAMHSLLLESLVAATLGGASHAFTESQMVIYAACEICDRILGAMLEDKKLSVVEKLEIKMLRVFLKHVKARHGNVRGA